MRIDSGRGRQYTYTPTMFVHQKSKQQCRFGWAEA